MHQDNNLNVIKNDKDEQLVKQYDVSKPDFTEYGLKSAPECNNR